MESQRGIHRAGRELGASGCFCGILPYTVECDCSRCGIPAEPLIKLHIVTDWEGSSADGSELQEDALKVFDLPGLIHAQLAGLGGETFLELDLVESDTNHNHEDIVESIEVYQCVAIKRLQ